MNAAAKARRLGEKRQKRRAHVAQLKSQHLGRFARLTLRPQRAQETVLVQPVSQEKKGIGHHVRRLFSRQKTV